MLMNPYLNGNDANVIERRQVMQNQDDFYKMKVADDNESSQDEDKLIEMINMNKRQFGSQIVKNKNQAITPVRRP